MGRFPGPERTFQKDQEVTVLGVVPARFVGRHGEDFVEVRAIVPSNAVAPRGGRALGVGDHVIGEGEVLEPPVGTVIDQSAPDHPPELRYAIRYRSGWIIDYLGTGRERYREPASWEVVKDYGGVVRIVGATVR
jgi:hypothetical protein